MKITIQIINELSYQTYPLLDKDMCVEVNPDDLTGIGTTKKFDLATKTIVSRQAEYDEDLKRNRLQELKSLRSSECFSIINRGELWYSSLTNTQREELAAWYKAWLDVTVTEVVPTKPDWLK